MITPSVSRFSSTALHLVADDYFFLTLISMKTNINNNTLIF